MKTEFIPVCSQIHVAPSIIYASKIVKYKIFFCPLHENARRLLATCEHLREFLKTLKVAEEKDESMIREVILPYLNRPIAAAKKGAAESL